ncbi:MULTISPECIES: ATP-binding protein [unclassified Bacillus (in: firmicutes)]|uniref:ATP-binding protein n=1 Tax=unclassified Bacillus (in: firmicutes) TaxID=185979 RepID=UPI0008E9ECB6|nr:MULTISPECIES: ATP-binding protein [unclassified Bacillus (in: firmicutes)]SFJ60824.1 His Kinase A (phospho-acceptor) domain-containing protein [Bacillus sp. 71mf]SFT19634.1 His Kinase A (phospho-acceptor) domain-containing protein [Bacillus sp. 103mf]
MDKAHILIQEEVKALKLFLSLFYVIFFLSDILYYYFYPKVQMGDSDIGFPEGGLGFWMYPFMFLLLLIAIYFIKKKNIYIVKYIIFIGYIFIEFIDNIMIYYGTTKPFDSGNAVEPFLFLFSPIFVNKRYFRIVSLGIVGKYAILGIMLHAPIVIVPIVLCVSFATIAFILLTRFQSYICTIENMFEEAQQAEKLAVIGKMATTIAHEIRNPLTSLKGFTQMQREKHPEDVEYYNIMVQEIERMNAIVSELMVLGKPKKRHYTLHNIKDILYYVISIVEQTAAQYGITISTMFVKELPSIKCDEKQMKQVFLNIIKNAIESMPGGGNIIVEANRVHGDQVVVSVIDEGCGMEQEKIDKIGEAFYTTKENGTGLGLMVTYKILEEHQGEMEFESRLGIGTKVNIKLPVGEVN